MATSLNGCAANRDAIPSGSLSGVERQVRGQLDELGTAAGFLYHFPMRLPLYPKGGDGVAAPPPVGGGRLVEPPPALLEQHRPPVDREADGTTVPAVYDRAEVGLEAAERELGDVLDQRVSSSRLFDHPRRRYLELLIVTLPLLGHIEHLSPLTWCPRNLTLSRDGRRPASEMRESVQNQGNGRRRVTLKGPTPEELRSQPQFMLSRWLR